MLEPTPEQIDGFARYKAGYLPDAISAGPEFRPAIAQSIASLIQLAEPEICARRKAHIKSALPADEFRERILLEDGARLVIGGIRFRNLDPNFPFVEVNASFDLFETRLIDDVASLAKQQFAPLAPRGILSVGPPNLEVSKSFSHWAHTLWGPITRAGKPLLPAELTCTFPHNADFYDEYRAAYAQWQASSPGLSGFVRAEPREDLQASAAEGLLASLSDSAGWCGVIAAREEPLYGSPALYIYEIFLVERWRGKGAAKAMDAALLSNVASRYSVVWESIHAENFPSLHVALAQGRSLVETEYFLPI